jgi:hypothetical protein
MRFYLKLLTAVAIFVCGLGLSARQTIADLAFDLHVAYVCQCGSAADFEKLLDDTQKSLAEKEGGTDCYEFGKRYQRLRAERVAAAAEEMHGPVSEAARLAIDDDCAREAFGFTRWARKSDEARRTELTTLALHAHEFSIQLD